MVNENFPVWHRLKITKRIIGAYPSPQLRLSSVRTLNSGFVCDTDMLIASRGKFEDQD